MNEGFRYSSSNWFGKASAGLILGFGLALALSGIFAWAGPGGLMQGGGKTQFNMWLMSPVWALVLSLCFLFKSGWRAWGWLGLANAIAFGVLFLAKTLLA